MKNSIQYGMYNSCPQWYLNMTLAHLLSTVYTIRNGTFHVSLADVTRKRGFVYLCGLLYVIIRLFHSFHFGHFIHIEFVIALPTKSNVVNNVSKGIVNTATRFYILNRCYVREGGGGTLCISAKSCSAIAYITAIIRFINGHGAF